MLAWYRLLLLDQAGMLLLEQAGMLLLDQAGMLCPPWVSPVSPVGLTCVPRGSQLCPPWVIGTVGGNNIAIPQRGNRGNIGEFLPIPRIPIFLDFGWDFGVREASQRHSGTYGIDSG